MMDEKGAASQFTRREERRLLEAATDYVKSGFPNPERLGCPGSEALKSIAGRHLNFPEAEDIVDHIATCSPCFLEYNAIVGDHGGASSAEWLVLCCGFAAHWAHFALGNASATQNETVAHQAPTTTIHAVLDFRNRTVIDRTETNVD